MSVFLIVFLAFTIVATSFLSGLFGMAGGLILMGILLFVLPLPAAMALHAVTQIASNVSRAVLWRRHIRWQIAAAYANGCLIALLLWSAVRYVPDPALAILMLGVLPFLARLVPERWRPRPERVSHGMAYGVLCMTLMMLTGVAGPVLDQFFLSGRLDRREIVATKGVCQIVGHGVKLIYFGAVIDQAAELSPAVAAVAVVAALVGTALSTGLLETMGDRRFRRWAGAIVTAISGVYVVHGGYLVATG